MKRIIPTMITLLLLLTQAATAQERPADSIFGRFSGEKGYTSVNYGKKMLAMMKDGASDELSALLDKIELIRIISSESNGATLSQQAYATAENGGYELISSVTKEDTDTSFLLRDEPDGRLSLLMISLAAGKCVVLDIYGIFDVRDISRLSTIAQ